MILYTSVSPYSFYDQPGRDEEPEESYFQLGGNYLQCHRGKDGFSVMRLISTDPAAYLQGDFSPGSPYKPPDDRR